jgi:hypothetical protein
VEVEQSPKTIRKNRFNGLGSPGRGYLGRTCWFTLESLFGHCLFPPCDMSPPARGHRCGESPSVRSRSEHDKLVGMNHPRRGRPVIGRKATRIEIGAQISMGPPVRGYLTGIPPFHDPSVWRPWHSFLNYVHIDQIRFESIASGSTSPSVVWLFR